MTRQFNPLEAGLSPQAVEQIYNILLKQKLSLEAKVERMRGEMAVAVCAIDDGKVTDMATIRKGLVNLMLYSECKVDLFEELDSEKTSIDLINSHLEKVKKFHSN